MKTNFKGIKPLAGVLSIVTRHGIEIQKSRGTWTFARKEGKKVVHANQSPFLSDDIYSEGFDLCK